MMVFKFRLLNDEVEDFQMDIEVPYDMNLLELHNFIRKQLGYNPCEIASFFTSDSEWEKLREFTLIDMGFEGDFEDEEDEMLPPMPMEKVTVANVMRQKFDRMIYVFDMFAERQLFMELLESKLSQDGVEYPRVVSLQGKVPAQFKDE